MRDFKSIKAWQRAHAMAVALHNCTRHFRRAGHHSEDDLHLSQEGPRERRRRVIVDLFLLTSNFLLAHFSQLAADRLEAGLSQLSCLTRQLDPGTSIALKAQSERGPKVSVDPGVPLRPQLDRLEEKIEKSLDEVCEDTNVKNVNTGELIRIEETLAIAAEAAKEAVSLRMRLKSDRQPSDESE
ncbi:MAG TPA: hypothetical protein VH539_11445 [Gemmatimonadaceae bacterium]